MSVERVIESLTRLANSVNGNPRYRLHFSDGSSALTQSDAAFCYGITNPGMVGSPVLVDFSRAGRVVHVRKAS